MSELAPDAALRDRYPGPRSFADDKTDRRLFFGRDKEIETLTHRVRASRQLVLFGKSGLGKTSLLQAGLFPGLRAYDFLPIPVRFDRGESGPVATVIEATLAACRDHGVEAVSGSRDSLWAFFRTTDLWGADTLLTPALVLDQFEEVFTLRDADFRRTLAVELRDLAGHGLPEAARRLRVEEGRRLAGELPLRLVLSLREEYLGALEELVTEIPDIFETRFRLLPLDVDGARAAIEGPAAAADEGVFRSTPFSFSPPTLDAMLRRLADRQGEYEPFELQILCQHVERRVIERQRSQGQEVRVDAGLLPADAMSRVLENFYRDSLRSIDGWLERRQARNLCERGLLSPDNKRVSLEESGLRRTFKLEPDTLNELIQQRLIRKDTRPGLEGFYYELSHDSLIEPVRRSRDRQARRYRILATVPSILLALLVVILWEGIYWSKQHGQPLEALATRWASWLGDSPPLPTLVEIPRGSFLMGSDAGADNEGPVREAAIAERFYLGETEVTVAEYAAYAEATGRKLPSDAGWTGPDRPVINVDWDEAAGYARWVGAMTGTRCRLPDETEWEYACRAGTRRAYAVPVEDDGSEDIRGRNLANCADCGSHWDAQHTAPVRQFGPNPWGLYDMHGNVSEWTADCYEKTRGPGRRAGEDEDEPCNIRVVRGGSWFSGAFSARCSSRVADSPGSRGSVLGFRILCESPLDGG